MKSSRDSLSKVELLIQEQILNLANLKLLKFVSFVKIKTSYTSPNIRRILDRIKNRSNLFNSLNFWTNEKLIDDIVTHRYVLLSCIYEWLVLSNDQDKYLEVSYSLNMKNCNCKKLNRTMTK